MKKLLPLFCGLILISCQNQSEHKEVFEQKTETKTIKDSTNTSTNEATTPVEDKDMVQKIPSFDFIDKYKSDNFFKNDIDNKPIAITNLIVDGYEIEDNGNVKLYCLAYSPEKSLIYLSDRYIDQIYNAQYGSNSNINIDSSNFQIANKRLSWVKNGRFDGNGPQFFPETHGFLIVLIDPKKIKELSCYDGAKSTFNVKFNYSSHYNCIYTDVIGIKGIFKIKSDVESSNSQCCPKFIFENCGFTKNEIN